ncbi:MAG: hypothetical protein GX640_00485, partial [Fibrobacter sp.]|nr:hypothetical protein [Fibrobacter sp.]
APETFTFSVSMKFGAGTDYAGLGVCFQTATNKSYSIFITKNPYVVIFIPGEENGRVTPAPSVSTTNANVVTVSKKGSEFNVFVNNEYVTSFTDAQLPSGGIALNVRPKSTVVYDNVVLEDTFRPAAVKSKITDDFEDGIQNRWVIESNDANVTEANGKLNITTSLDSKAQVFAIANLFLGDSFKVRTEVSMVGGDSNTIYGLTIRGEDQLALFVINGECRYGTLVGSGNFTMGGPSSDIMGKPFKSTTTYFYVDTMEITQSKSTGKITFSVNGVKLAEIPKMNFSITEVGIYCQNNIQLQIDNFYAENYALSSIKPVVRGKVITPFVSSNVYDVLGRLVTGNIKNQNIKNNLSNGVYFMQGQRGRVVLTNR